MAVTLLSIIYTIITFSLLSVFLQKENTKQNKPLWWLGFGILFNFLSFTWLYTVYPLSWLPEGLLQIGGLFLVHITVTLAAGVPFFIIGYRHYFTSKFPPLIFALSVTVAEIIRSLCVSLLFLGEGTSVNLHFTAGTIGNALAWSPFIEYAYIAGTFSLTFIVGYVTYVFQSRKNLSLYWKHVVGLGLILMFIHTLPTPEPHLRIGVVTTFFGDTTPPLAHEAFSKQNNALHAQVVSFSSSSVDMIVLPEDSRYLDFLPSSEKKELREMHPTTLLVDGTTARFEEGLSNLSYFYTPREEKRSARSKEFILPFNEYIPYAYRPLLSLFFNKEELEEYLTHHTYTPITSGKVVSFNNYRVGTIICSEAFSHATLRNIKKYHPDVLFYQARLHMFHTNPLFIMHLRSFISVAAAYTRTPVISSINGAPSYFINAHGKIIQILPVGASTTILTLP